MPLNPKPITSNPRPPKPLKEPGSRLGSLSEDFAEQNRKAEISDPSPYQARDSKGSVHLRQIFSFLASYHCQVLHLAPPRPCCCHCCYDCCDCDYNCYLYDYILRLLLLPQLQLQQHSTGTGTGTTFAATATATAATTTTATIHHHSSQSLQSPSPAPSSPRSCQ